VGDDFEGLIALASGSLGPRHLQVSVILDSSLNVRRTLSVNSDAAAVFGGTFTRVWRFASSPGSGLVEFSTFCEFNVLRDIPCDVAAYA
jgi:hypothetical protein